MCEQGLPIPCGTATDAFAFQNVIYTDEAALNAAILAAYPDFVSWATPYCLANLSSGGTTTAIIVQRIGRLHDGSSFLTCPLSGLYTFDGNVYDLGDAGGFGLLATAIQNFYGVTVSWDGLHCAFIQIDATALTNILPAQIPVTPALPLAAWNLGQGVWSSGSVGSFYVSDPTDGITLKDPTGNPLTNCTVGAPDVEIEIFKNGASEGVAAYEIGNNIGAPLFATGNAISYLSYFTSAPVQDGSVFEFDKSGWSQATGTFGKTAGDAAELEFAIKAKDCYGNWSAVSTIIVEKQQILGGDNTVMDLGGGTYQEMPMGGMYDFSNDVNLTSGQGFICGFSNYTAPAISPNTTETDWAVFEYTKGGITNTTHRPIYSAVAPAAELAPELKDLDGYVWNFGTSSIPNLLWVDCVDRVANYYYSQPIPESATDLLTHFAVGNEVYSNSLAVRYHINPITWF